MTKVVIEAAGLTKELGGRTVLDGLDLEVEAGEILGFVGPNGAGKTTTWSLLAGLLEPTDGRVRLLGQVPHPNDRQLKLLLGFVPDDPHLFEGLTARELLLTIGRLYELSSDEAKERSDEVLEAFDLLDAADQVVATFSHGMKKKVAFSAAILHAPRLLFLDEPFEGMDAVSARTAMGIVTDLAAHGSAVFVTSHHLDYVERLCTRLAVIQEGRVLLQCAPDDLGRHLSPAARMLEGVGRLEALIVALSGRSDDQPSLSWIAGR